MHVTSKYYIRCIDGVRGGVFFGDGLSFTRSRLCGAGGGILRRRRFLGLVRGRISIEQVGGGVVKQIQQLLLRRHVIHRQLVEIDAFALVQLASLFLMAMMIMAMSVLFTVSMMSTAMMLVIMTMTRMVPFPLFLLRVRLRFVVFPRAHTQIGLLVLIHCTFALRTVRTLIVSAWRRTRGLRSIIALGLDAHALNVRILRWILLLHVSMAMLIWGVHLTASDFSIRAAFGDLRRSLLLRR